VPDARARRLRAAELLAVLALVAAAAWLRLAGLSDWQLSWDDMWHLMDAQQASLLAVLDRNLHDQIHGPLAYVLRYGLLGLSHDPLALRATSLVPGLLLVPVFALLGRELLGRAAGLFLAAVAAFADALVVLSQVLRAYSLLLLLLSLALLALAVYERTRRRGALAAFGLCAALAAAGLGVMLLTVNADPEHYRRPREDFDTRVADLEHTLDALARRVGPHDVVLINRVGMQYLNLYERLFGEPLLHVGHDPDHYSYPYDRWVVPGGEEHVFRGVRFWACDGPHEWSAYLGAPRLLRRCVEPLVRRRAGEPIETLWVLVPMREAFLVLAAPRPGQAARAQEPAVRDFLLALRRVPFWQVFFRGAVDRVYTPTAGAVAVPFSDLEREWERLGPAPAPTTRARPRRRRRRRGPSRR
jgi:hypothetical protein